MPPSLFGDVKLDNRLTAKRALELAEGHRLRAGASHDTRLAELYLQVAEQYVALAAVIERAEGHERRTGVKRMEEAD
jgi:hypothetical protein